MATADRILQLKLVSDVGDINKQMRGVTGRFKGMASSATKWGKAVAGAFVLQGIDTLVGSLGDAIEGFKEGEDAARNVSNTWRQLGLDTDRLASTLDNLGEKAISLGFDDAEVQQGFNLFLTKTGNVHKSLVLINRAMDLARGRNISLSRAIKLVAGDLDGQDKSLKRNKDAARRWARNHPLEVTLGRISDLWETFVGSLSKGRIQKALDALGGIGQAVNDLIFGRTEPHPGGGPPRHIEGLIDRFAKVGPKILDAITGGLTTLGEKIQQIWDEQIANVDWTKAIPDALGTFWRDTLQPFLKDVTDKGPAAAAAITLIAAALAALLIPTLGLSAPLVIVALALAGLMALFATPVGQAALKSLTDGLQSLQGGLQNIQTGLQNVQTGLQNVQTFLRETFQPALDVAGGLFKSFADGLDALADGISTAFDTVIGHITNLVNTVQGIINTLIEAWNNLLDLAGIGTPAPGQPRPGSGLVWDPVTGKWKRYEKGTHSSTGGMALVGEKGPELIRLPAGSRVWSADETAGMMGGGGWGGTVVNVNITTGVGDPVEIGRQVDRVLRAYRVRAGVAA